MCQLILTKSDFDKIVASLTLEELAKTEAELNLSYYVTLSMYDTFKSLLSMGQLRFA